MVMSPSLVIGQVELAAWPRGSASNMAAGVGLASAFSTATPSSRRILTIFSLWWNSNIHVEVVADLDTPAMTKLSSFSMASLRPGVSGIWRVDDTSSHT